MLKPLLHVIPSLSGNVTLACHLSDYEKVGDMFECHVRVARLVPLSSNISIKKCEVSLLTSSYEFDIQRFYSYYPNYFYKSMFSFNKDEYEEFVGESSLKYRDKDFEFGAKRVSALANYDDTIAFFTPFWAESEDDIPDYFLIKLKVDSSSYDAEKTIKVIIRDYDNRYRYNYLIKYLTKYFKQVDSNVIYCRPFDKKATYYGISVLRGGFAKMDDSVIGKNFYMQSSIDKFDENIVDGFRRMKLCMKQVMPLSFYFDLNDILTADEKKRYRNAEMTISGHWYKDGKKLPFYDFSTDYNYFTQKTWGFRNDGVFDYIESRKNVMDVSYPSLNEARLKEYKLFNTCTKDVVRWKLKYSKDDNPYITNMSFAFSWLQSSPNKYREFPSKYSVSNGYSDKDNNLVLPKKASLEAKDSLYKRDQRTLKRYRDALLANSSNWFTTVDSTEWYEAIPVKTVGQYIDKIGQWYKVSPVVPTTKSKELEHVDVSSLGITPENSATSITAYVKISPEEDASIIYDNNGVLKGNYENAFSEYTNLYIRHTIFDDMSNWSEVKDGKAYVDGIMYNLSSIWRDNPSTPYIDKFGVFVKPVLNALSNEDLKKIKTARWTIMTGAHNIKNYNAFLSTEVKKMLTGAPVSETKSFYINELGFGKKTNEVTHDSLFFENTSSTKDGEFVDLTGLGYDIYEINKYYKIPEIKTKYPEYADLIENMSSVYSIHGFEFVPIYRLSQVVVANDLMFYGHKMANAKWIYESLYVNGRDNHAKSRYGKDTMHKIAKNGTTDVLEYPMSLENDFISAYNFSYIVKTSNPDDSLDFSNIDNYSFNPILVDANEVFAENMFSYIAPMTGKNYGQTIPDNMVNTDLDFIYVSQYNLKNALPAGRFDMSFLNTINSSEMYCKIINEEHLIVYMIETHKNYDKRNNVYPPISTLYIKKRVLLNNYEEHTLQVKDEHISVYEAMYGSNLPEYEMLSTLLKDLEYCGNGCWKFSNSFCNTHDVKSIMNDRHNRVNNPEDYKFELVYKTTFVKLNKTIWDCIHIENYKEYRDFYLYKVSRERNYPKELVYFYDELDEETLVEYEPTGKTIEPLFNSIWLQDMKATIVYSEWQQSKITEANYGRTRFYRYDCDDIPYMYDLSDFDLKNSYFSNGNSYYVSHAYMNNALASYNADPSSFNASTIQYKIANGILFNDNKFSIMPTFNMLEQGKSSISLAYGTIPSLHYFSTYSYNTIIPSTYTSTAYYSDSSFGRINVSALGGLDLIIIDAHYNGQYENADVDDVTYHALTSTFAFDSLASYHDIHARYMQAPVYYDDLGLFSEHGISTYTVKWDKTIPVSYVDTKIEYVKNPDGITTTEVVTYIPGVREETVEMQTTYGMIWIASKFDNTNSSFNLVDLYNNDKKFFTSIDGESIYDSTFKVSRYFKEICPFMKTGLRDALKNSGFVAMPSLYTFTNYWKAIQYKDDIMQAYYFSKPLGSTSLERYFDAITPYIPETDEISTYSVKYKDTQKTIIKDDLDMPIYKETFSPFRHTSPRIYKDKAEHSMIKETEWKHFNDSMLLNLEHEFTIDMGRGLTYAEVMEIEQPENVLHEFAKHMRKFMEADDSSILFLYNKYNVKYDSQSIGIDYNRIEKVYSLKLKFILK